VSAEARDTAARFFPGDYEVVPNGVLIPDANAAQLMFQNAGIGDSAQYSVVVSNSSGSIASSSATLLVVSAMSAMTFAPVRGAMGVCNDTPLTIQFDQPAKVGKTGRIGVYNSRGALADTIDLAASPQTRLIGGVSYVYFPVIVNGATAVIYPHQPLPYGDSYYVTMEPGAITDASGAPFAGFSDANRWSFTARPSGPSAGADALIVAADGTGDFCTVQSAIDYVPAANTQPVSITVRAGTYTEINYVPSNKPFITIRGEDRDGVVIQYANNANVNNGNSRAMFGVDAPDFTLENLTLYNTTPRGGSQAEAFRGNNQRILLNRVNLKSFQDTLLLQGAALVANSYIEGDVDFTWGIGAVYFQNCELKSVTSGGYYAMIRNTQGRSGNVYVNCRLTSAPGVSGVYLARIDPIVFPYSQVAFINCAMDSHIIPAGWLLNNSTTAPDVQFWEHKSTDLSGAPLDVGSRISVSRQLTAQEATDWSDVAKVLGGWSPFVVSANASSVAAGARVRVDWSANAGHSAKDWVGLYAAGDPDAKFLSRQYTGRATAGHVEFVAPARAGQYEFRYFLNDGFRRTATGNRVMVR